MPSSSSRDIPKSLIFRAFFSVTRQLRAAKSLGRPRAVSHASGHPQGLPPGTGWGAARALGFTLRCPVPVCTARPHLWMQCLLSRYSMPAAAFSVILISSFTRRCGPSLRRKLRKSPPAPRIVELACSCLGTPWRACTCMHRLPLRRKGCRMGLLTLHQLHDYVNGLLLGADTDEPDNVRMVVLFEDPVRTRKGTVSAWGAWLSQAQGTSVLCPGRSAQLAWGHHPQHKDAAVPVASKQPQVLRMDRRSGTRVADAQTWLPAGTWP